MTFATLQTTYSPPLEAALTDAIAFHGIHDSRHILIDAMRHSVQTPGKRIRPFICMAIEMALKNTHCIGLPIGVAIELIHCYSLIHDDLPAMDNDDFRRGKPTCHKAFGEDMAILAGDTLNTYAFEYFITQLHPLVPAPKLLTMVTSFANACGIHGMAGGQVLDLKASANGAHLMTDLKTIHALKTGALLEACFTLTAQAVSDDPMVIHHLKTTGAHFGMLFQIVDDILDETGTLKNLGKSPGKDSEQNKLTYVSKLGLDGARREAQHHRDAAIAPLTQSPHPFHDLRHIIDAVFKKGIDPND
jgi:geranylgeranyl diphosphate synthase type II